jgi:hypothetical protein
MDKLTAEMYVKIFKDVIRDVESYADKTAVKKHNAAYTKIAKEINKIRDDREYLTKLFGTLLTNEDDKIKLAVANDCLQLDILTDKAIECLNQLKTSTTLAKIDLMGIDITLDYHTKVKSKKG